MVTEERQICGESHEVDDDGIIIASETASTDRMQFYNLRGPQTVDPEGGVLDGIHGSVQIDLEGSANLPLSWPTPDIDYSGTLTIDRVEGNVLFQGAISGFPAFELYFVANDNIPVILARNEPINPIELVGKENRLVRVSSRILL